MSAMDVTAVLTKVAQQQQAVIAEQQQMLVNLQARIDALEKKVALADTR
jgi:hypothetical protein